MAEMDDKKKKLFDLDSIPRTRIPEIIVSKIKEKIFSGDLRPGEKLPSERELVLSFNTSRITVRSAIRTLETLGLIEVRRGAEGGAFVKEINSSHCSDFLSEMLERGLINIYEVTETRLLLEPDVAKLAAERATDEDISSMKECIEKAKKYISESKRPRIINIDFHNMVAKATHNKMIYFEITSLTRIMAKNVDYSSLDNHDVASTIERHQKIFEAIKNYKPDLAFKEMYNDIEMVYEALKKNDRGK